MKQRILGIDASRSTRSQPTGVERYSTEIISALIEELGEDFQIRLYTPEWISHFPKKLQKRIRLPRLWSLLRLSLEMLVKKPEFLFIPAHVLPFFAPKKSYVTIHDVAYEKYPMAYGGFQSFYLEWSTRRALRKAKKVIVPTEAVKKDLIKYYDAKPSRIIVVHHGRLELAKVTKKDIKYTLDHYRLPAEEPLFFFIGRLETKKNLMVLLDAWAIVQRKNPQGRLFLGGMYGHGFNDLFHRMENPDLRGTVIAPGYIPELEAASIFQAATALVLPSREEGFGLPILQSFEANCAVICSDIPALREVGGDAALYADPGDAEGFAKHMLKLLKDHELKEKLAKKGQERIKKFSWENAAKDIAQILRD
ncbi:MAG: glycosyltransferase involved in cell wall biosynthesis [Oceanicoccus sp.]|jgi:glycosyltransferase involved in cell wall biosynthesis